MKVFSVVDKPVTSRNAHQGSRKRPVKKRAKAPMRENLTADQIRAKVKAFSNKNIKQTKMTKSKLQEFNSKKIPDMHDADKAAHRGDIGINDPNDLATHGKLKQVLSMNAFSFSEREKAALEQILED